MRGRAYRWLGVATLCAALAGAPAAALDRERLPHPPEAWAPALPPRLASTVDGRWAVSVPTPDGELSLWREPGPSGLVRADHGGGPHGLAVGPIGADSPPPALTGFADQSAVAVFTGLAGTLVAHTYHPAGQTWSRVTTWPDDLRPQGDYPPQLVRRDAAVVLLAVTRTDDGPGVLQATTSNTAGRRWSPAVQISDATTVPAGTPTALILPNGHVWIAWRTTADVVVLRLLHGAGQLGDPHPVAPAGGDPTFWLEPTPPDVLPRFVLQFTSPDGDDHYHRVIPPAPRFTWTRDCGCDPTTGVIRGHPLRGEIVGRLADAPGFEIRHDEIPGIISAGTRQVRIDPRLLDVLAPGQPFLARIERRDDGHCWLFDLRLLRPVTP
jgi:hypothetical protein